MCAIIELVDRDESAKGLDSGPVEGAKFDTEALEVGEEGELKAKKAAPKKKKAAA